MNVTVLSKNKNQIDLEVPIYMGVDKYDLPIDTFKCSLRYKKDIDGKPCYHLIRRSMEDCIERLGFKHKIGRITHGLRYTFNDIKVIYESIEIDGIGYSVPSVIVVAEEIPKDTRIIKREVKLNRLLK